MTYESNFDWDSFWEKYDWTPEKLAAVIREIHGEGCDCCACAEPSCYTKEGPCQGEPGCK